MRPVLGSTRVSSCHSHPGWFSSLPQWWSTANRTRPVALAAPPSHTVERPQYEPTSTNGAPGTESAPSIAASWSASPSFSGMNPRAASACARNDACRGG